jgi:hypothetical protein
VYQAAEEGTFPATPPSEILGFLNEVGPRLGDSALCVIEMLLEDLWRDGLVGMVPAPSPRHARGYLSRESAEVAVRRGAPVILLPLKGKPSP